MRMRLTEVHKPLASAYRSLRANTAFLNSDGGVLFPKDSLPGKKLEKHTQQLWEKYQHLAIPLYQENGVYNMYIQPSAELSGAKTASAVGPGRCGP
eukprot:4933413-Amphidinium_carterae.1